MQAINQLKWACRRGMLELDVLLGNFLAEAYPHLSASDQANFAALLATPDPVLFDYLMGKVSPEDARLASITEIIRHHAVTRI